MESIEVWKVWADEVPQRRVDIEIRSNIQTRAFAFEGRWEIGQYVDSPDQLTLEARHEREEREKYEALKQRYEGREA